MADRVGIGRRVRAAAAASAPPAPEPARDAAQVPALALKALELRAAGVEPARIALQLDLAGAEHVDELVQVALGVAGGSIDEVRLARVLELDRLDRLQRAVWAKALQGDVASVDRAMRLSELRVRLVSVMGDGDSPLLEAYEATIKALSTHAQDTGLVEAGRRLCRVIDQGRKSLDPALESKSAYLVPQLVSVLRELGATPAVRNEIVAAAAAPVQESPEVAQFAAFKQRKQAPGA